MKIKLFCGVNTQDVEKEVNKFISEIEENKFEVVDIKLSACDSGFFVMVEYKEYDWREKRRL